MQIILSKKKKECHMKKKVPARTAKGLTIVQVLSLTYEPISEPLFKPGLF